MQARLNYLSFPILRVIVPPAMKKHRIDTAWFLSRIEAAGYSMNSLAPKLSGRNEAMNYASLYNLIHGDRAMSFDEAVELSEILGVGLDEMKRRVKGKRG